MERDIHRWHNTHPIHSQLRSSIIGGAPFSPDVPRSLASLRYEARWLRYAVRSFREHVRDHLSGRELVGTSRLYGDELNHPVFDRGTARVSFEEEWVKALLFLPDGQQRKVWIRRGSDIRRSLCAHDIPNDWVVGYGGLEIPDRSYTVPTTDRVVSLKVPAGSEVSKEWILRYEGINLPRNVSLLQIGPCFARELILHLHRQPRKRTIRGIPRTTCCGTSTTTEESPTCDNASANAAPVNKQPTADRTHDHTRGVRIGEARHPGPSSDYAICYSLGGRELHVEPGTVQCVKEQISDQWEINIPLQRILFEGRSLGESEIVAAGLGYTFLIDKQGLPSTECARCGENLEAPSQLAEQFAAVPTVDYDKLWICGVCSHVICLQCRRTVTNLGQRGCPSCEAGYDEFMAHLAASAAPGVTRAVFLKQKATRKCHCPLCLRPCRRKSTHSACYCDRDHRWPCSAFCKRQKGFNDTRASILTPTPPSTPGGSSDGEDIDTDGTGDEDDNDNPSAVRDHPGGTEHLHYPDRQHPYAMQDIAPGEPPEDDDGAVQPPDDGGAKYCPECEMWVNGSIQWTVHLTGKKHKKNVRRGRRAGI